MCSSDLSFTRPGKLPCPRDILPEIRNISRSPNSESQWREFIKQEVGTQIQQALHQTDKKPRHNPYPRQNHFVPRMDLLDDESTPFVIATFELPGVRAKDVRIEVKGDALLVSGIRCPRETTLPPQVREALLLRSQAMRNGQSNAQLAPIQTHKVSITYELRYGPFRRIIKLPPGSQNEDISACFQEGMLIVTWPRIPTAARSRSQSPNVDSQSAPEPTAGAVCVKDESSPRIHVPISSCRSQEDVETQ